MKRCFGLTGMIGPSKLPANRLSATTAPTDEGFLLAPISAIERGLNRNSRLRIVMSSARCHDPLTAPAGLPYAIEEQTVSGYNIVCE